MIKTGKVISVSKEVFVVFYENEKYKCKASNKLLLKNKIIAGDFVEFEPSNLFIKSIYKRKNEIIRPNVSNIDKVFIVSSIAKPKLSTLFLNQMIHFYYLFDVEPILVFTKKEYLNQETELIINEYKNSGYKILMFEKDDPTSDMLDALKKEIKSSTAIFAGQSGVGKSTLANKIIEGLNIKTNSVSKKIDRGRHTTTSSIFYRLGDGFICDTPGFSTIKPQTENSSDIANAFKDFAKLSNNCKFNNCIHLQEKDCPIKDEVNKSISEWRYNDYVKIIKNLSEKKWK